MPTRLTSSARSELDPKWSADGQRLVFTADWQGPPNVYVTDLRVSEPRVLVPFDRTQQYLGGWTPEGSRVVFSKVTEKSARDLWVVGTTSGESRAIFATAFDERLPAVRVERRRPRAVLRRPIRHVHGGVALAGSLGKCARRASDAPVPG